ncbi:MAG: hypothetical protein HY336_02450 [Candidatus Doudnabacteria bacterium]|nr:hypothetical protein [Candidatus Doudnabacteria bacterium]
MPLQTELSRTEASEIRETIRREYAKFVNDQIFFFYDKEVCRLLRSCIFRDHETIVVVVTGRDQQEFEAQVNRGRRRLQGDARRLQKVLDDLLCREFGKEYERLNGLIERIQKMHSKFQVGITLDLRHIQPTSPSVEEKTATLTEASP